jgi:Putative MetA-pathway of phenol degradation
VLDQIYLDITMSGGENTRAGSRWEADMPSRALALTILLFCYAMAGATIHAQTVSTDVCPNTGKLICTLPEVFGPAGLQQAIGPLQGGGMPPGGTGTGHKGGHFEAEFINTLAPLNAAVGSELTLLPLGSPGSGLVYVYDPTLKTFTASTVDLGPILTERANTTGRHKVRVGFSYQRFSFSSLDGTNVHSLPASFTHIDDANPSEMTGNQVPVQPPGGPIVNCSITTPSPAGSSSTGLCGFVRDRIDTVTNLNLRLNQYTASATFGLTNRIDVSLAIPIINVGTDLSSVATIINNSNTDDHVFKSDPSCPTTPCRQRTFTNSSSATGIGDIVLRAKGVVWSGERAAVAVGADLRFPTGDELNFLGSGTYGFTPFAVFSYTGRVSPHVNVGYQVNGNSVLAGDIIAPTSTTPSSLTKGHLPNQFLYSGGADVVIIKTRLAGTFDLIGQRVFNARRETAVTQSFLGACGTPNTAMPGDAGYCTSPAANVSQPTLTPTKGSFNIINASLGAKVRVSDKLVIFGNALIKLDNGGLRAKVVPLVGASFSF